MTSRRRVSPAPSPQRRIGPRGERGAAAVEFALVSMLLLPLVFGIIDYGLWFADSLSARQAVRDAARSGVVQTQTCTGSAASGSLEQIACMAAEKAAPMAGDAWAKVVAPADGWAKNKPLIVCLMVKETGAIGLVPLPADRIIRAKTSMAIEVDATVPSDAASGSAVWPSTPALPTSATWGFCA